MSRGVRGLALVVLATLGAAVPAHAQSGPQPGSPEYVERDNRNIADAYGRQTGQQSTPEYTAALIPAHTEVGLQQLAQQMATPNRLALTPGNVFPGWNGGNPLRHGWEGRRGMAQKIAYTNRYGALIRGTVWAPLPGARDPYTGRRLKGPFPGVVITTGSVQGSEGMYEWLAQDLAERGYVVMTYDVQGQGTSETLPHENDQVNALPFCNPFAEPQELEQFGCPGVPAQQGANFIHGTRDAMTFFLSTPKRHHPNRGGQDARVNDFNPYWRLFDRRRDRRTVTKGRTTKLAIVGHSLGAFAVSYVQGVDKRVQTVVALDKLSSGSRSGSGSTAVPETKPVVPALALQAEYGFNVNPYWNNHGSSLSPSPRPPNERPDPRREQKTGWDKWRGAGVDSMLIVPRASTHLEWTDITYVLPASRWGQALSSVYTQLWLDRYLKHNKPRRGKPDPLVAESFTYLEPTDVGEWTPVEVRRDLSFYFCSGWDLKKGARAVSTDPSGVGGC